MANGSRECLALLADTSISGARVARQAHAERLCRKLQWQLPRRMPQRDTVLITRPGTIRNQQMEVRLQSAKTTLIAAQSHAQRIYHENGVAKTGRMKSKTNRQTLQYAGGKTGLRSDGLLPCG